MKKPLPVWFTYGTLGILMMFLGLMIVNILRPAPSQLWARSDGGQVSVRHGWLQLDAQTCKYLLRTGLTVLERSVGEDDPYVPLNLNWPDMYWKLAVNIKSASPKEMLRSQIPLLAMFKPKPVPIKIFPHREEKPKTENSKPLVTVPERLSAPQVLIYHTHTAESYLPVSGKDYVYPKGDIVQVGRYIKQILEERYGIPCVHDETDHDYPPHRLSYERSLVTLKKSLATYPSLKVVLDIHRDATPGVEARCEIKGESTATIGIVVGKGNEQLGLLHPEWNRNYQFAKSMKELMDFYYPGLNRRVLVHTARYNQHLHHHALIIEFGDHQSSFPEVYRAAGLFAEILALEMNKDAVEGSED